MNYRNTHYATVGFWHLTPKKIKIVNLSHFILQVDANQNFFSFRAQVFTLVFIWTIQEGQKPGLLRNKNSNFLSSLRDSTREHSNNRCWKFTASAHLINFISRLKKKRKSTQKQLARPKFFQYSSPHQWLAVYCVWDATWLAVEMFLNKNM